MAFHCAWLTSYFPISKAFVMRTWCCGFSSVLQLLSSGEHPIMNSPAGIFANSMPMAFFSAPVWACEDTCATRQVTAIANMPTKTTLMCLPPQLCLGACFQTTHVSIERGRNTRSTKGTRKENAFPVPLLVFLPLFL